MTTVTFAAVQGLASLANGGMIDRGVLDDVVGDAVHHLVLGLRPR